MFPKILRDPNLNSLAHACKFGSGSGSGLICRVETRLSPLDRMMVFCFIQKVGRLNRDVKRNYMKIIMSLLTPMSAAVMYECAGNWCLALSVIRSTTSITANYCFRKERTISSPLCLVGSMSLKTSQREVMMGKS